MYINLRCVNISARQFRRLRDRFELLRSTRAGEGAEKWGCEIEAERLGCVQRNSPRFAAESSPSQGWISLYRAVRNRRKLSAKVPSRFRHTSSVTRRSQGSRINIRDQGMLRGGRSPGTPMFAAWRTVRVFKWEYAPRMYMSQLSHALVRRLPRCGAEGINLLVETLNFSLSIVPHGIIQFRKHSRGNCSLCP